MQLQRGSHSRPRGEEGSEGTRLSPSAGGGGDDRQLSRAPSPAHHLFDGMREGFDETAAAGGEDRIGALPDALLQHVLSFLPSREAVRTCVLARRWRYQWKSVPALRITDAHTYESAQHLNKFVNYLIVLRDRSPLHECEIKSYDEGSDDDERFQYTELWIRYALSCQVRVLRVHTFAPDQYFELPNAPLLSRHLTRLELEGVELMFFSLDFSSCPALEMLKMNDCHFASSDISSPSLQWLSITDYSFGDSNSNIRTLISVPSLIHLELDGGSGRVPFLNSMPSLVTARVRLDDSSDDICDNGNYNGCDDDTCHACYGLHDYGCVLLNNLSGATNLELIADPEVFIFRKDLKWCPTFRKLKTLLLNEWCVEPEFGTLVYFLQHSPILEKLTLQLNKTRQPVVETEEGYSPTEQLLVLKHLRVVEIKCHKEDEWVHKILKILSTYGVPPEQINIQQNFRSSESFSSDSEQLDSEQSDSAQSDSAQSDSEQSDAEQSD